MRTPFAALFLIALGASSTFARVAIFEQPGFPTVASQPVSHETLVKALDGPDTLFIGVDALKDPGYWQPGAGMNRWAAGAQTAVDAPAD